MEKGNVGCSYNWNKNKKRLGEEKMGKEGKGISVISLTKGIVVMHKVS